MRLVGGLCTPLALLLAACSVSSGSKADSGPEPGDDGGGPGPDAPEGAAGLVLEFHGVPELTADLGGTWNAVLEEVRIDLENVRAVGDAAPGDERTTRAELRLEWWGADDDGGDPANNEPVVVSFNDAPPGLYSNVYAELIDYRLQGKVDIEAEDRDFEIVDQPGSPLAISIPLGGVTLEAGETRHLVIDVSCAAAVVDTPWDQVAEQDGNLLVDSASPQIGGIRDDMEAAFAYQGGDGTWHDTHCGQAQPFICRMP
jgi:hypothetical protein